MLRPSSLSRLAVFRPIRLLHTTASRQSAPDPRKAKTNDSAEHAADKYPSSEEYRQIQKSRPLNPHLTNTTSTSAPAQPSMPSAGAANAPPELLSAVDPSFTPTDTRNPENANRMTGGSQPGKNESGQVSGEYSNKGPGLGGSFGDQSPELGTGEIPQGKFKIEPLRRVGEDDRTMRARLLYQSRKRGILETDLLLSTFAHENLEKMERAVLEEYDRFLDENDWDIYYWATQLAPTTVTEYAEGGDPKLATDTAEGKDMPGTEPAEGGKDTHVKDLLTPPPSPTDAPDKFGMNAAQAEDTQGRDFGGEQKDSGSPMGFGEGPVGEWAQTVGRSREPYRPPPSRWRDSRILKMIRSHVEAKKGKSPMQGEPGGLGRMPDFK